MHAVVKMFHFKPFIRIIVLLALLRRMNLAQTVISLAVGLSKAHLIVANIVIVHAAFIS